MELRELIVRHQDDNMIFNVFEVTRHHNENPQCYQVDAVEDVGEEISLKESPLFPIEYVMVNSINVVE